MVWANLPDPDSPHFKKGVTRLIKRFPDIFVKLDVMFADSDAKVGLRGKDELLRSAWGIRETLRAAWDAPDARQRDFYIFRLRELYDLQWRHFQIEQVVPAMMRLASQTDPNAEILIGLETTIAGFAERGRFWGYLVKPPPQLTPFEQVMVHFQRIGENARHCPNPECPAPYFFARRRQQRYCSEVCAEPAQREAKRRWWNANRAKGKGVKGNKR